MISGKLNQYFYHHKNILEHLEVEKITYPVNMALNLACTRKYCQIHTYFIKRLIEKQANKLTLPIEELYNN